MNKFEANISLCIITFFASIQYAFIGGVPDSVSQFGYLTLTNAAGFFIVLLFFFGELFRLDKKQIIQSLVLSLEQVAFNVLLILGAGKTGATVTSCILSAYFVFIPPLALLLFHEKPDFRTFPGIAIVVAGLFFMMNCDAAALLNRGIFYLLLADIVIAITILTISRYSASSNPSVIAMGQLFFSFVISGCCWIFEVIVFDKSFALSTEPSFWICVLYISFFIRGLYSIVQLYAMRYVSPLSSSLIFSTEIIMTMLMSPVLAYLFGTAKESVTFMQAAGAVIMVAGILLADSGVFTAVIQGLKKIKGFKISGKAFSRFSSSIAEELKKWWPLIIAVMIIYSGLDFIFQKMQFTKYESIIGLKNFIPVTAGLLWGIWGVLGSCLGCIITALFLKTPPVFVAAESFCNIFIGIGLWTIWHSVVKNHYIGFKHKRDFLLYIFSLILLSFFSAALVSLVSGQKMTLHIFLAYTSMGIFVSLPLIILFGSLLNVQTALPSKQKLQPDIICSITADQESLAICNEKIEEKALACKMPVKRIFEVQSCIEELSIRVFKALPDTSITLSILFGNAISVRIVYQGKPYDPFRQEADDNDLSMAGLRILRHRALRASVFSSRKKLETKIHIVI